MEQAKSTVIATVFRIAIAGNILFALWILYNGINENFQGSTIERVSYLILIALLSINAWLLIRANEKRK